MDRINYNSALAACARGSRWHHALQLLVSMSKSGAGVA
jgi:pentatricopeptide repeat protein